ncbi:OLC1v1007248C1 [Oldenlandia corymbosa var. corymbosa]|uniref:OLC1v1007248C1 n=1 Tax=Oldenlandia corymbosa var. corymbosa TaxID=529605 RepID=A0AAV1DM78_OLDCO|nr:OLC1v1007248C1 [Oldenlandia corymbosa var. corymbosa]
MDFKRPSNQIGLAALVLVICWTSGALAQSGCTTELATLYPCLNYVSGNSSSPSSTCCSQLGAVVRSNPQCLCLLLNGGASSVGLNVNETLALELPDKCNVQTPGASKCNGNAPSSSSTPAASSNQTPGTSNQTPASSTSTPSVTNTPAGSKTVPAVDGSPSAGSSVKASFILAGFFLLVALYGTGI